MIVSLGDARGALSRFLTKLRMCAKDQRAVVTMEDPATRRFVRFYGSTEEPLWLDSPHLTVASGPEFASADEASEYAIARMREECALQDDCILRITLESTKTVGPS